jgi:hypothetical protein
MDYPSVYADVVAGATGVDVDVLRCFAEAMVGIEATGDVTLALDQAQLVLAFGQYGDAVIDAEIKEHMREVAADHDHVGRHRAAE